MALPFLLAGVRVVLVAMWSFWSPEKQQTAVLRNGDPASRESSACTGKVSEKARMTAMCWLVSGRHSRAFPLSHPDSFCARQSKN